MSRSCVSAFDRREPGISINFLDFRRRCIESTTGTIIDKAKASTEAGDVQQFGRNDFSESEKDSGGEFAAGRMHW